MEESRRLDSQGRSLLKQRKWREAANAFEGAVTAGKAASAAADADATDAAAAGRGPKEIAAPQQGALEGSTAEEDDPTRKWTAAEAGLQGSQLLWARALCEADEPPAALVVLEELLRDSGLFDVCDAHAPEAAAEGEAGGGEQGIAVFRGKDSGEGATEAPGNGGAPAAAGRGEAAAAAAAAAAAPAPGGAAPGSLPHQEASQSQTSMPFRSPVSFEAHKMLARACLKAGAGASPAQLRVADAACGRLRPLLATLGRQGLFELGEVCQMQSELRAAGCVCGAGQGVLLGSSTAAAAARDPNDEPLGAVDTLDTPYRGPVCGCGALLGAEESMAAAVEAGAATLKGLHEVSRAGKQSKGVRKLFKDGEMVGPNHVNKRRPVLERMAALRAIQERLGAVDHDAEAAERAREAAGRAENRDRKQRNRARAARRLDGRLEELASAAAGFRVLIPRLCVPEGEEGGHVGAEQEQQQQRLPWVDVPAGLQPTSGETGGIQDKGRSERKRWQLESLFQVLQRIAHRLAVARPGAPLEVVDFGSGSGNSALPFAALMPGCNFTMVDAKRACVEIGRERTSAAGLTNVAWFEGDVADFNGRFDIGLATHLCGEATDLAMAKSLEHGAAFLLTPCCVGKIKHLLRMDPSFQASEDAEPDTNGHYTEPSEHGAAGFLSPPIPSARSPLGLEYPRSRWLRGGMTIREYGDLVRLGDYNGTTCSAAQRLSKELMDADRLACAAEAGYETGAGTLWPPECTPKNDVLVGWPAAMGLLGPSLQAPVV